MAQLCLKNIRWIANNIESICSIKGLLKELIVLKNCSSFSFMYYIQMAKLCLKNIRWIPKDSGILFVFVVFIYICIFPTFFPLLTLFSLPKGSILLLEKKKGFYYTYSSYSSFQLLVPLLFPYLLSLTYSFFLFSLPKGRIVPTLFLFPTLFYLYIYISPPFI